MKETIEESGFKALIITLILQALSVLFMLCFTGLLYDKLGNMSLAILIPVAVFTLGKTISYVTLLVLDTKYNSIIADKNSTKADMVPLAIDLILLVVFGFLDIFSMITGIMILSVKEENWDKEFKTQPEAIKEIK